MKTQEEVETLNNKLKELTDKELEQVYGGLKLDSDSSGLFV